MTISDESQTAQKKIAIYTLDTRFFFLHYSLKARRLQNLFETMLPNRLLRLGGPRSVLESIVIGAKRADWDVVLNPKNPGLEFDIVLNLSRVQIIKKLSWNLQEQKIRKHLLGPNIDLKSLSNLELIKHANYDFVLVPSEWAKKLFDAWGPSRALRTTIWDAGVDTQYWKTSKYEKRNGFVVYVKGNQSSELVAEFCEILSNFGPYRVLKYGEHSREKFKKEISTAKAVIWLGTTETQGIAICEAWSLNTPTFILEQPWRHILGKTWASSSAPYLSPQTGIFIRNGKDLIAALKSLQTNRYEPREWVLNNQTAELSFARLTQLK